MEIVLLIETKNYQKVREILLKDEIVSRASIIFKEAKLFGEKEGFFCYISGLEEQCNRALELIKRRNEETGETIEFAKEVKDNEKEGIINKIKEEEKEAIKGFGQIIS